MDMILGCIVSVLISAFGMHAYDASHMQNKDKAYSQKSDRNYLTPDNINIYVGASHNYLVKGFDEDKDEVGVPK